MKNLFAGLLVALISTSAFAQADAKRTSAAEGQKRGSEMSKQKFQSWQDKKRDCYLAAKLEEGKHFRTVDGGMKFQVNSVVHLGGFDSAAIDKCDAL